MFRLLNRLVFVFLLWSGLFGQAAAHDYGNTWVLIDTKQQALFVMSHDKIKERFNGIAIGQKGVSTQRFRGSHQTPLGVFRINWVNTHSRYHLFLGLDYPNFDHAERAYLGGRIDFDTFFSITSALQQGVAPPQNTVLGGNIGIHGVGSHDARVHKSFNWTDGCIALTNEQIDRLAQWVAVGTRVVIL